VPSTPILFVPFMGAVIGMRGQPRDALVEARVGLAGPLLGSLAAALVLVAGDALDSRLLVAAAYTGFFLNLFNLLPITPLDGGRAAAAVHPALWLVGLGGLVALMLWHPNPILLVILVLGASDAWRRYRGRRAARVTSYYRVGLAGRVAVGIVYLGLAALLVLGMHAAHVRT
jgi:Zn-dependent protease